MFTQRFLLRAPVVETGGLGSDHVGRKSDDVCPGSKGGGPIGLLKTWR
jgi:hypothetical protein